MRIGGKIGIGVAVLGMVLSTTQAANAAPAGEKRSGSANTITLITGDRVVMHGGTVMVRPAEGREQMKFSRFNAGGHTYVLPHDARKLVSTGQLDQRLFDLTTLVEFGYDDAHRDSVPLIVTHQEGQRAPRTAAAVSRELPSINGVAIAADKDDAGAVWEALTDGGTTRTAAAGVSKVWLDGKRKSTLDHSVPQIGAPAAWEAGFTGTGVKIAVLDTGVDQTHPDLADQEVAEQNFTDDADNVDTFGHGTHVASIAAGTGAKSGGKYRGVAPGADILDGKVLNSGGFGLDSWIIAGMEWAAEQGADVANLSLGGFDAAAIDPMEQAVESLSAEYGTLFVIAAGNSGPGAQSVGSPGSAPSALTVGAVDRDNALAPFSSRGPAVGTGAIKPDITAPGVEIVAALHSAGTINAPVEDGYTALSGTSMATPHVAGAAALIAQQHPDWTGQQLKSALSGSATPTPNATAFEQGAGRVDVAKALDQTVVSEPANVGLGVVAWPHDDDDPVTKSVTYRNLGTADVTLDLALEEAAPANVFSLSANQITVPAGGTASVDVTGDTDLGTVDGGYSATVVASNGDSVTRTPVGIVREAESYNLTLNYVDENGQPSDAGFPLIVGLDSDVFALPYDADGSVTVRLPKGRYLIDHLVLTANDEHTNLIVQPGLVLDGDKTVDVDPRIAKSIDITAPESATLGLADIGYQVEGGLFAFAGGLLTVDFASVSTAQIGDVPSGLTQKNWVNSFWFGGEGSVYGLAWFLDRYPTGFTKVVKQRELATVRRDFGPGATDARGVAFLSPQPTTGSAFTGAIGYELPLPGSDTAFVNTQGLRWQNSLWQVAGEFDIIAAHDGPLRTYRQGRTYHERFNFPSFGPGLPARETPWASRVGDRIDVNIPLYTDSLDNAGFSAEETASTKLFRNDQLVGESPFGGFGFFDNLPAARGNYRLTTESTRSAQFDLTTSVNAEWTFRSSHVDGTTPAALPLNVVRFAPKLAEDGSAPAGKPFLVPLTVQDKTGASVRPKRLSVEVSYDEGKSWQRVPVVLNASAVLQHPAGAPSVSLRASATDRDGNTVTQTVIRVYKLK
ncbi:S8 family serine peptidase [Actinophytocola sp.]|uniref:S8 family serine peptidase n=1 Tax=Actinophytocola sp. TaxID=1872138 RepID=UPI002ED645E4